MKSDGKRPLAGRTRLADVFVEDILDMSDADILAEFKEAGADPVQKAEAMRALFEKSVLATNKSRLVAARNGVARRRAGLRPIVTIGAEEARRRLKGIMAAVPHEMRLTLAARKEEELSDADVLGMLEDLAELGLFSNDGSGGKR